MLGAVRRGKEGYLGFFHPNPFSSLNCSKLYQFLEQFFLLWKMEHQDENPDVTYVGIIGMQDDQSARVQTYSRN